MKIRIKACPKYAEGGDLTAYNPNLAANDAAFQKWYRSNTMEGKRGLAYSDKGDYDYYSFFRNGGQNASQNGHFPDTYKRPNHKTFSNESIYSTPENPGGSWNGDKFIPHAADGLQVEGNQYSHISPGMIELGGKSHEQGGTDISYNGQNVEAEKGEPVSIGDRGEAIVWGNMNVPGTGKKFKSVAKEIGKQEAHFSNLKNKSISLVADNDPESKWERPGFNSGRIMQIGAELGQQKADQKKTQLAALQKALLMTAHENNLDPQELSKGNIKKAKKGAFLPYKKVFADEGIDLERQKRTTGYIADDGFAGDPVKGTVADRHNNPGNIKWGKFAKSQGAQRGEPAPDGGYFAKFPNREAGFVAMHSLLTGPSYNNLSVKDAINKWTGGHPYSYDLGDIAGKKVSDLAPHELAQVQNTMTGGEGTKYGPQKVKVTGTPQTTGTPAAVPPYSPIGLPNINLTQEGAPAPRPTVPNPPGLPDINVPLRKPMPTNAEGLDLRQIAPEIYGFATNKQVPVALQKYTPQLYVPYQMSFQDQINDNTATSNATRRLFSGNPALASSLAANEYEANNRVRAGEFRTNQGIQADTINKNIALNNDAQMRNLQLSDQQYVRQSEAASRTKEINQAIMNSISSKYQQNSLDNKRLKLYENLYDYRFDNNTGQAKYYGPDFQPNYNGPETGQGQGQGINPYSRTVVQKNEGGVTTRTVTPSYQDIEGKSLRNQKLIEDKQPLKRWLLENYGRHF